MKIKNERLTKPHDQQNEMVKQIRQQKNTHIPAVHLNQQYSCNKCQGAGSIYRMGKQPLSQLPLNQITGCSFTTAHSKSCKANTQTHKGRIKCAIKFRTFLDFYLIISVHFYQRQLAYVYTASKWILAVCHFSMKMTSCFHPFCCNRIYITNFTICELHVMHKACLYTFTLMIKGSLSYGACAIRFFSKAKVTMRMQ